MATARKAAKSSRTSRCKAVMLPQVERLIYVIRDRKVMLGADLAMLYEVETKALNRAVKRNLDRFPGDFMFQLTRTEAAALVPTDGHGGQRYRPFAFTEHGALMLASGRHPGGPRVCSIAEEQGERIDAVYGIFRC